jgi:hypothetical protein
LVSETKEANMRLFHVFIDGEFLGEWEAEDEDGAIDAAMYDMGEYSGHPRYRVKSNYTAIPRR